MKRIIILILILFFVLLTCGIASADFYEDFDDPADYDPPDGYGPPYCTTGTFFDDYLFGGPMSNQGGGSPPCNGGCQYTPSHIDHSGNGKAFRVYIPSDQAECLPALFTLTNYGVRWKFDLYIYGSGPYESTFGGVKFWHYEGNYVKNSLMLHGFAANPGRYLTDLTTGELTSIPTLSTPNVYFSMEMGENIGFLGYTDILALYDTWMTVEIEIKKTSPKHLKVWVNDVLDIYRKTDDLFDGAGSNIMFVNFSDSAGGDFGMAVDEFYEYDYFRDDSYSIRGISIQ